MNPTAVRIYPLPCEYSHADLLFDARVFLSYEALERHDFIHGQIVVLATLIIRSICILIHRACVMAFRCKCICCEMLILLNGFLN